MTPTSTMETDLQEPTSGAPLAIETERLTKVYGSGNTEVVAMQEACMQVRRGEVVALLGPSGSGKSTFLTAVGLINPPTSGRVSIGGQLVLDGPDVPDESAHLSTTAHRLRLSEVEPDPVSHGGRERANCDGTEWGISPRVHRADDGTARISGSSGSGREPSVDVVGRSATASSGREGLGQSPERDPRR
jgi:energy-coupling factor transporter ATP-binding protein EcfA2